jgi:hypothetical protein
MTRCWVIVSTRYRKHLQAGSKRRDLQETVGLKQTTELSLDQILQDRVGLLCMSLDCGSHGFVCSLQVKLSPMPGPDRRVVPGHLKLDDKRSFAAIFHEQNCLFFVKRSSFWLSRKDYDETTFRRGQYHTWRSLNEKRSIRVTGSYKLDNSFIDRSYSKVFNSNRFR